MDKIQNIYDDETFFNEYQKMRDRKLNANELLEIPTITAMLPDLKGKTILDLGCGSGGMSRFFIENGAKKVVAIDVSENMINAAKNYNTENIEYKVLPMENLSEIDEKFDLIFSSLAFHYIEDFNKLISDISKLLNQDGMLLYSQEHPVTTALIVPNDGKKYVEIDDKRYYLLSDYNNVSSRILDWNMCDVKKYHRNFETIINSLIKNNLNIIEIKEPSASEQAIKLVPKYVYQKDRPLFLYVKAKKN